MMARSTSFKNNTQTRQKTHRSTRTEIQADADHSVPDGVHSTHPVVYHDSPVADRFYVGPPKTCFFVDRKFAASFRSEAADVFFWNNRSIEGQFATDLWENLLGKIPCTQCAEAGEPCVMATETTRPVPSCQRCRRIQKGCSHKVTAGCRRLADWSVLQGHRLNEEQVKELALALGILHVENGKYLKTTVTSKAIKTSFQVGALPESNYGDYVSRGMPTTTIGGFGKLPGGNRPRMPTRGPHTGQAMGSVNIPGSSQRKRIHNDSPSTKPDWVRPITLASRESAAHNELQMGDDIPEGQLGVQDTWSSDLQAADQIALSINKAMQSSSVNVRSKTPLFLPSEKASPVPGPSRISRSESQVPSVNESSRVSPVPDPFRLSRSESVPPINESSRATPVPDPSRTLHFQPEQHSFSESSRATPVSGPLRMSQEVVCSDNASSTASPAPGRPSRIFRVESEVPSENGELRASPVSNLSQTLSGLRVSPPADKDQYPDQFLLRSGLLGDANPSEMDVDTLRRRVAELSQDKKRLLEELSSAEILNKKYADHIQQLEYSFESHRCDSNSGGMLDLNKETEKELEDLRLQSTKVVDPATHQTAVELGLRSWLSSGDLILRPLRRLVNRIKGKFLSEHCQHDRFPADITFAYQQLHSEAAEFQAELTKITQFIDTASAHYRGMMSLERHEEAGKFFRTHSNAADRQDISSVGRFAINRPDLWDRDLINHTCLDPSERKLALASQESYSKHEGKHPREEGDGVNGPGPAKRSRVEEAWSTDCS
ncbi:hypothetical protein E1B28_000004 [Marasmius oreades]|uniref:Uncharacterized protein n=1 Tax=Marasmius oreades TaxID=181124 RepID=A0A9P7V0I4_9AGAR|nr:uncharacterized protein E1B28_000004 [Marasmius oreades]KAG7098028.1 hypothetical protein E1B28_000004 [Marasmius oreades]